MKIGDYVRTKNGIIGKIETKNYIGYSDWLIDTLYYNDDEIINGWTCGIKEYDIIKSSSNIIDLIEVGDYVNGRIVDDYIYLDKLGLIGLTELEKEDEKFVKSILTKELFEGWEYKI